MKNKSSTMQEIQALYGATDFKAFCTKLECLVGNRRDLGIPGIVMSNLIIAAEPGCGTSRCIRLLASLMEELRIIRFIGEESYFEQAYFDDEHSYKNLIARMHIASGFYGRYQGIIAIDMSKSDWRRMPEIDRLLSLANRLQEQVVIVFIIPYKLSRDLRNTFRAKVASYISSDFISIARPSEEETMRYVMNRCYIRGFAFNSGGQESLRKMLCCVEKSTHYSGYKTLNIIANQIVWQKISCPNTNLTIGSDDISALAIKDVFMPDIVPKEKRRIGFGEGR